MGRSAARRADSPRRRNTLSGLLLLAVALVLLFAVVGVVSAGMFLADKISGSKTTTKSRPHPSGPSVAVQDVVRAQAQATAIVKTAQAAGHSIVSSATSQARRQSKAILAAARHQAAAIKAASATSSTSTAPTAPVTAPQTIPQAPVVPQAPAPPAPAVQPPSSGPAAGNLGNFPAAWKVVAHNITFGRGPGSAGSVTVTNRGDAAYSGVVTVACDSGGSASAAFNALPAGQTEVLPLDGRACPGGRYSVPIFTLH